MVNCTRNVLNDRFKILLQGFPHPVFKQFFQPVVLGVGHVVEIGIGQFAGNEGF